MDPFASDAVRVDREGAVAVLVLADGARRNALTAALAERMISLCDEIDADESIGAVVVYGEGGYFCAGGDRGELAAAGQDPTHPERFAGLSTIYRAFTRVGDLAPPTIAAVVGGAVGAGMNLLLNTDLRIVASDAKLISGFTRLGIHPGGGHFAMLAGHAGRQTAAAMGLFGAAIDGLRAVKTGLAWAAVDADAVLPTALELARNAAADPVLARAGARSMRLTVGPPAIPWAAALDVERSAQMWSMRRKSLGER